MSVNYTNVINKTKHHFVPCISVKYLWMSNISLTAIASKSTLKSKTYPFNRVFFILSTEKFFELFPRYNRVATVSESFTLNLWISTPLTNKKLFAPL